MASFLWRPLALGIYLLFFVTGLVSASVIPTLSVFFAQELGVRPLLVGLPFAGVALASLVYNHWIGHWSDTLKDRRLLIAACCFIGAFACAVFAFSRTYWIVATTAIFLFSLSMISFSQMLAYSLDYAEKNIPVERIPLFNAVVRTQIALAWVIGPPCGFLLAAYSGFTLTYGLVAILFSVIGIASLACLPRLEGRKNDLVESKMESTHNLLPATEPIFLSTKKPLYLCVIALSLMWGANNAYLITLPLHLLNNLNISAQWSGLMMGTCALLEVPFMILAGHYATRVSLVLINRLAAGAAIILYIGMYYADSLWQLFSLQLFNAIFVGVIAGLGVSVIQEYLPGRSGGASGLFTNTTHMGTLIGSAVLGLVAEHFGYESVFLVNLLLIGLALLALAMVSDNKNKAKILTDV